MICYRCGNTLGSGHLCLRCGADVTVYRKIIGMSNGCYNAGLEKARVRDLTGAVSALRKSVQLNKANTDARNLLGLVYYEMGEVVEALCQWIVSKNLQPENNMADHYLDVVKSERNSLEEMNQAIKKYNQALYQARNESVDLAIITLKRVLKQHPKLIKAYQLLALCYIQNQEYSKANRILKKALEIDAGNTLCLRYSRQIRGKLGSPRKSRVNVQAAEEHRASMKAAEEALALDDDIVVPKIREKRNNRFSLVLTFLGGILIALVLFQFVILPTVNRNSAVDANKTVAYYDSKMADQALALKTLTDENESLKTKNEDLQKQKDAFGQYDQLMNILLKYMDDPDADELAVLADEVIALDRDAVDSELYQQVYDSMYDKIVLERLNRICNQGINYFNDDYYTNAIECFEKCLSINETFDKALYYLGLCYEHRDDQDKANSYFLRIVKNCPDSDYYEAATDRVGMQAEDSGSETADEDQEDEDSGDEDSGDEEDYDDEDEDVYDPDGEMDQ